MKIINLSVKDEIIHNYNYLNDMLQDGLNCAVDHKSYNNAAVVFGFEKIGNDTDSKTYCSQIYKYK